MLEAAGKELLSFTGSPVAHWRQIRSTNSPKWVTLEIERRTGVLDTLPYRASLLRLAWHVLIEQHDECDDADRRHLSEHFMKLPDTETKERSTPEMIAAFSPQTDPARC